MDNAKRIAQFLFEIGTLRKTARSHRQTLLTNDLSDNIASHSFRVAHIGIQLALIAGADWQKVAIMCIFHDTGEARGGDQNFIHKKYLIEDAESIFNDQLGTLPFSEPLEIVKEYEERKTLEAILAKDADILDQILLLREYAWQGNQEAMRWLKGDSKKRPYAQLEKLKTDWAKDLGRAIYDEMPSSWWTNSYSRDRRTK